MFELAGGLQVALVMAVARRERFLSRTTEPATALEMRQLTRQFAQWAGFLMRAAGNSLLRLHT